MEMEEWEGESILSSRNIYLKSVGSKCDERGEGRV